MFYKEITDIISTTDSCIAFLRERGVLRAWSYLRIGEVSKFGTNTGKVIKYRWNQVSYCKNLSSAVSVGMSL